MLFNFYLAIIIALFHSCVGRNNTALQRHREQNEKTYQKCMGILRNHIVTGSKDPNRIEWLTKISQLLTDDRELFVSLGKISLPATCPAYVNKIFSLLEKRNSVKIPGKGQRQIVSSASIELLQTMKEYNDKTIRLAEVVKNYEIDHIAYSSYKIFFNSISSLTSNYDPESLVKQLNEEYTDIVKNRQKMSRKIGALLDLIDYNVYKASNDVYSAMIVIQETVDRYYESNIDVEINQKISEQAANIRMLNEFVNNRIVEDFNLDEEIKTLKKSEEKLSKTLKSESPSSSQQNSPPNGLLPKFLQKTLSLYAPNINPARLNEYRASNAKNFDAFSVILQDKITAGLRGPEHLSIDSLARISKILSLDRVMYISFNIQLPVYIEEYLDRILNPPLKDEVSEGTSQVLQDLGEFAGKVKDLRNILDEKEIVQYTEYKKSKPVYKRIKESISTGKGFKPKTLKKYENLLNKSCENVTLMREAIIRKTHALRHVIDKEILPLEIEVNVILAQIYIAILTQEPKLLEKKKRLVEKELAPKVVKLNYGFTNPAIIDFFYSINDDIAELKTAEKPLNEAFYNLRR